MIKRPLTIALEHLAVIIDDLLAVHIQAANSKQRRELLNGVLAQHVLDVLLKSETLPAALKALDRLAADIRRELEAEWDEAQRDEH
jgi:hypothetical protein